jgi:hypothetical protein
VSASEFAFLALGLVLGVIVGAAVVVFLRSRTPSPEVRLTVTPDSVPRRRATTLAEDAFEANAAPARGGPADPEEVDRGGDIEPGEKVGDARPPQAPAAVETADEPDAPDAEEDPPSYARQGGPTGQADIAASPRSIDRAAAGSAADTNRSPPRSGWFSGKLSRPPVAIAIRPDPDEELAALRNLAAAAAERAMEPELVTAQAIFEQRAAAAVRRSGDPPTSDAGPSAGTSSSPGGPPAGPTAITGITGGPAVDAAALWPRVDAVATDPSAPVAGAPTDEDEAIAANGDCTEVRRVAEERCTLAARMRAQAVATHDALRESQRSYDEHLSRAERATGAADPRAARSAKDTAQHTFRATRASADTPDAVEAAAREWLSEINRINHQSREAAASAAHEREEAAGLAATMERLTLEAHAARISAETAEAACLAARQALAECEVAVAAETAGHFPTAPSVAPGSVDDGTGSGALVVEAVDPVILRMLRGDRTALGNVVAALAGGHPEERRRWRLLLSTLVDEILARAIEVSCLAFPLEHPFWSPFTIAQDRDITTALASLGYRFDGLGGWVDDRVPSQRDLSLAVGYAGLDPMRIRHWPNEAEMTELFRDVTVAGDEYLVGAAADLSLGELVTILGPRADDLAELWNDWGRVRPLLLAD